MTSTDLDRLLHDIRACRVCADQLPLGPRPVVRAAASARILIIGQAPGTKVHESGIPWNDPSGERLRDWLQVTPETFYDETRIAIMPMGFCYPGTFAKGGDLPPRPECAPTWHDPLRNLLPNVGLTLLVGSYAQKHYLGKSPQHPSYRSMTDTVRNHAGFKASGLFPTPHPSWRTIGWAKRNPWFETDVIPALRKQVHALL